MKVSLRVLENHNKFAGNIVVQKVQAVSTRAISSFFFLDHQNDHFVKFVQFVQK